MIKLFNSLTKNKDTFDLPKDKPIKWYTCGPTIYDEAHLGHARTFMTFDIIRRILSSFGYNIIYQMNLTDIDDKIINKVFELTILDRITDLIFNDEKSKNVENLLFLKKEINCNEIIFDSFIKNFFLNPNLFREDVENFLNNNFIKQHIMSKKIFFDKINLEVDKEFYSNFIKKMENEFWEDIDSLNILRPTVVTRVTEYVEKMIKYIQEIIDNDYAYENNGSVYIDSQKMIKNGMNFFPLKENQPDDFSENEFINEKKHPFDFALWKKSTDPSGINFDSKWSKGRMGWHLECSVMATDILGENIDIHSGGIDLLFPHHNNELVQNCAHDKNNKNWVKFFLHSGHLHIDGLRMGKSLKNFITIKDYLKDIGTSNQLRLLFLFHKWNKTIDYNFNTLEEIKNMEKKFLDYLQHINYIKKDNKIKTKIDEIDNIYYEDFIKSKLNIENQLLDNIDTQTCILILLEFINKTYKYLTDDYNLSYVLEFTNYLENLFKIFGLEFKINKEKNVKFYERFIDLSINLREDIRNCLISNKININKEIFRILFEKLDDFRDNKLKQSGIKIEDKGLSRTKWSYHDCK